MGRAPFHAAKREEIYKKLKAREYSWPDLAKFSNEITDDLRDVVGSLLVHEDERPTPDQIVSHAFFKLGHIPMKLDTAFASRIPKWTKIRVPGPMTIKRGYTDEWAAMCKASAVGEYEPGKTYGAYGSRRNKTVAKDCQTEIKDGKQPSIPFAKDTVYLPFPARTHWPYRGSGGLSEITEEKESSSEGMALTETTGNDRTQKRATRDPPKEEATPPFQENIGPVWESETVRRVLEKPSRMRSIRKISNPDRVTAATAVTVPIKLPRPHRPIQRTKSAKSLAPEKEVVSLEPQPLHVVKSTSRINEKVELGHRVTLQPTADVGASLPLENAIVPFTDPATVLARLARFRENLARALQKKPITSSRPGPPELPYISKWVDFSRKHGVAFAMEDGAIGLLMRGTQKQPVTVAIAPDGVGYLREAKKDRKFLERFPFECYADTKGSGLFRYAVKDPARRRQIQTVWTRFGTYMTDNLSQFETNGRIAKASATNSFVKFYQRLGNVGIWGFSDGAFQVCFPPHVE